MSTYKELLKQREVLEQQIKDARQHEIAQAVAQVRGLVAEFGLTAQDVFPSGKARSSTVHTKVAINYHLDPSYAVEAYKSVGPSTDILAQRIIIPAMHESVKAVTALFTAEELITQRTVVRDQIASLLKQKMMRHGLVLDEFNLINFAFSRSFADAIENKVKAEQQKQQAERDLQRLQVEAQQKVVGAKAEAESLALQRLQITPELLSLRRIENERAAIAKWDGKLPTVTSGATPFINVDRTAK